MDNTNYQPKTEIPVEAYAACVRILIEWDSLFPEEDNTLKEAAFEIVAKKAVQSARKRIILSELKKNYNANGAYHSLTFSSHDEEFMGHTFDDYVQDVYLAYLEKASDSDEFSAFLQKRYEEDIKRFQKKIEKIQEKVIEELEAASSELSDQEFDDLITQKYIEFLDEIEKLKKHYPEYIKLAKFMQLQAQNNIARRKYACGNENDQILPNVSIDDEENSFLFNYSLSASYIDTALQNTIIEQMLRENFNDVDYFIIVQLLNGETQREIAKQLKLSDGTISYHVKKIKKDLKKIGSET